MVYFVNFLIAFDILHHRILIYCGVDIMAFNLIRQIRDGPVEKTGIFNSANIKGFFKETRISSYEQSYILSKIAAHATRMVDYDDDIRITIYIDYTNNNYEKREISNRID